jgi:hypothetical protein
MADLDETSQMLETSVRLQSASDALSRRAKGERLASDEDALLWAGRFLGSVDSARNYTPAGRLMMQATTARPVLYATLDKLRSRLATQGIANVEAIQQFLVELTKLLQSRGESGGISVSRVEFAASFLHEFSRGLLTDLWLESLPQRSTLMR